MRPRYIDHPSAGVLGWKGRQGRAEAKMAERQSDEHLERLKALNAITAIDDRKAAVLTATERRDRLAVSIETMRSKLKVLEAYSLQHGKVHPGQMAATFDIAASEKNLRAAESAVVDAQEDLDREVERQAEARAAVEDEQEYDKPAVDLAKAAPAPRKRGAAR